MCWCVSLFSYGALRARASLFVGADFDSRGEAAVLKFAPTSRQHRRKVWEFQEPFSKGSWRVKGSALGIGVSFCELFLCAYIGQRKSG
jgi:hypothetical protein